MSTQSQPYRLGLLGQPVAHSLSPQIHQAFLRDAQLNGTYEALAVAPAELRLTAASLRDRAWRGWNLTIPHKTGLLDWLDSLSEVASAMGAVNTVICDEQTGQSHGHNTDAEGFWQSLPTALQEGLAGKEALVIGAGGSARAVVYQLLRQRLRRVTLLVRSPEKARSFLSWQTLFPETELQIQPLSAPLDLLAPSFAQAALLVNCSPVGMHPEPEASPLSPELLAALPKTAFLYDLVYKPAQTRLMQLGQVQGLSVQNGLGMLVYQAAASFQCWTKRRPSTRCIEALIHQFEGG